MLAFTRPGGVVETEPGERYRTPGYKFCSIRVGVVPGGHGAHPDVVKSSRFMHVINWALVLLPLDADPVGRPWSLIAPRREAESRRAPFADVRGGRSGGENIPVWVLWRSRSSSPEAQPQVATSPARCLACWRQADRWLTSICCH